MTSGFSDRAQGAVASSCSAFTSDPHAESARQQTSLAGVGVSSRKGGGGLLQRAGRVGAGKENEAARREGRMQQQQTKAREDISRYCDALHLPLVAKEEAAQLFEEVAKRSKTRLKNGGVIDKYSSLVLASILCASRLVCQPRNIQQLLAVADLGTGETEKRVNQALIQITCTVTRPIPPVDPHDVIREMCRLYLPDLSVSFQQCAWDKVDFLRKSRFAGAPHTIAAVALVLVASAASGVCDNGMCQRVSEASGLAVSTLQKHAKSALM